METRSMSLFFKEELETLKEKTGLNQFETMKQEKNWKDKANSLIKHMVEETNKPPFDILRNEVKQRVIREFMLSDDEFIGLNAKWIRKALNRFWTMYGGKVLEAVSQTESEPWKPREYTPEEEERIKGYISEFNEHIAKIGYPKKDNSFTEEKRKRSFIQSNSGHTPAYNSIQSLEERENHLRSLSERTFRERNPNASDEQVSEFMNNLPSTLNWNKGMIKRMVPKKA